MPPSDEARQRAYYQATAASYHERHGGEHCSFLDVGAGTGRAMKTLATAFPQALVQGIKPVAELRQQAKILNGISGDALREGDALQLPFADDSFDWVVETGVLHHVRHWPQAVAEMARVARYGVPISDTNDIGLNPHRESLDESCTLPFLSGSREAELQPWPERMRLVSSARSLVNS